MPRRAKYGPDMVEKVRQMHHDGMSTWQIADEIGDNQTQVWRMVAGIGAYGRKSDD